MTTTVDDTGRIVEDTSSNIGGGNDESVFDPTAGQTFYENNGSSSDTSGNVVDRSYTGTGNFDTSFLKNLDPSKVSEYLKGNMGLTALLGGSALAAMGAGTPKTTPTIYQGGIPNLVATRNMITAPPTGRRAGAGGVNYGGDVTYSLAPAGQKPWANLRGDSGFITDPQGQANVLKGTGGADTQSMANKIGYNLPGGWDGFSPQQKIAWFNQNNVSYDQLLAAGVPQSDIDYMWSNGYTSGRPANWGKTTATGGNTTVTGGNGIDNLANAQRVAQNQADKINLKLPSDWSTYDAAKKIAWYNSNKITPEQLLSAGVDQATIDWMKQNGYGSASAAVTPTTVTPAKSEGLKSAIAQGLTEDAYTKNIKDWLASHADAGDTAVRAQMDAMGISPADVAKAKGEDLSLVQGRYDNAFKNGTAQQKADAYNMLLGEGLTDAQIRASIDKNAGKQTDSDWSYLQRLANERTQAGRDAAMRAPAQSAGLKSAIQQGMTEQQYLNNIENWLQSHSGASDREVADQMQQYGISADDLAKAHPSFKLDDLKSKLHALGVTGYAGGGIAEGRYLQGETDGMADKIPAQIGKDQPAALSHGEFVVPADVVSHLGNGNSDAGAKKLYQMMDRIRMARTGNKEQGKKINPDKFMPGGLAKAYAGGGSVMNFATGGTTPLPANVTGTQAGFSNWAGDYATNLLGQGQALANMPFQQYMGPLTAGPSALQNKVTQGLESLSFPSILGQSFSSAGAPPVFNPATMQSNLSNAPMATGAPPDFTQQQTNDALNASYSGQTNAPQGGMGGVQQPSGIAASYMNPYLQNVLQPQLAELNRQSQINLQPSLAKLTAAGGFGGGRQAIMESEANRNLLNAQNTAIGTGYANAYDKAMQQFNTEQGQAKTLADMMAGQGATNRAIEAEGVAADKAQFEEARANPFKMVQFQQSLLNGMPINAMDYTMQDPSTLTKVAQGVSTVDELLKVLYGIQPAKKVAGT